MLVARALCIGVDTSAGLGGPAEADACALADLATRQGFHSSTPLLGAGATRARARARLREAAAECHAGDLFMLTFSGHGGLRQCAGSEGLRGTWVLFDGSLDDVEMHAVLAEFRPGVRVLVISDSCNGGVPAQGSAAPLSDISASVLVLSACGPAGYADGPGLPGHFTTALLRAWDCGRRIVDYRRFYELIAACMPDYQRPSYYRVGARDPHFESQPPFTV